MFIDSREDRRFLLHVTTIGKLFCRSKGARGCEFSLHLKGGGMTVGVEGGSAVVSLSTLCLCFPFFMAALVGAGIGNKGVERD